MPDQRKRCTRVEAPVVAQTQSFSSHTSYCDAQVFFSQKLILSHILTARFVNEMFFCLIPNIMPLRSAKKIICGPKSFRFLVQLVLYNRVLMYFDCLLDTVSGVEDDVNFGQSKEGGR